MVCSSTILAMHGNAPSQGEIVNLPVFPRNFTFSARPLHPGASTLCPAARPLRSGARALRPGTRPDARTFRPEADGSDHVRLGLIWKENGAPAPRIKFWFSMALTP